MPPDLKQDNCTIYITFVNQLSHDCYNYIWFIVNFEYVIQDKFNRYDVMFTDRDVNSNSSTDTYTRIYRYTHTHTHTHEHTHTHTMCKCALIKCDRFVVALCVSVC